MGETICLSLFYDLLNEQIGHEFAASHQYLSMAIWLDGEDLPQLAKFFYQQSLEEREHALMMVQYKLDRGLRSRSPLFPLSRTTSRTFRKSLTCPWHRRRLSPVRSRPCSPQHALENYALGEQFILWFLKEQVEEVATMETLVTIMKRANGNLFDLENYVARELAHDPRSGSPATRNRWFLILRSGG